MNKKQIERLLKEGQSKHREDKIDEALSIYEKVIELNPKHSNALILSATIYASRGNLDEAERRAIKARKAHTGSFSVPLMVNFGIIMKNVGKIDQAKEAYAEVLKFQPNNASAIINLANCHLSTGNISVAKKLFEKAKNSNNPTVFINLSRISLLEVNHEEAKINLQKSEDLAPTHPDVPMLWAKLYYAEKNHEDAFTKCIEALNRNIASAESWEVLRMLDRHVLDLAQVEDCLARLSMSEINNTNVLNSAIDMSRRNWLWANLSDFESKLEIALKNNRKLNCSMIDAFTLLGADIDQEAHKKIAESVWSVYSKGIKPLAPRKISEKSKITIGLVSADLKVHPILFLMIGFFEKLKDRDDVDVVVYSQIPDDGSDIRKRFNEIGLRIKNIFSLSDSQTADLIRVDEIDVLIDLSQFTTGTRLRVFAYKPAPVQIQWLGMPGTTGSNSIDYVILDRWSTLPGTEGFTENKIILDRSYQPNDHVQPEFGKLVESRAEANLPQQGKIVGAFNQPYKFSPDTVEAWGKIFKRVDDLYFWLLTPENDQIKAKMIEQLSSCGVPEERIIFAEKVQHRHHQDRLRFMDLVLDTKPYNAHTTASDALRAGVPVLTVPGKTFASRVAMGILHTIGEEGWIADNYEEYIDKAVNYLNRPKELIQEEKETLKNNYFSSYMVDNDGLVTALVDAFKRIYNNKVKGLVEPIIYAAVEPSGTNGASTVRDNSKITDEKLEILKADLEVEKNNTEVSSSPLTAKDAHEFFELYFDDDQKITVVHLGDSKCEGSLYNCARDSKRLRVLGAEPNSALYEKIPNLEYLDFAHASILDGRKHNFYATMNYRMASTLEPNKEVLEIYSNLSELSEVLAKFPVQTRTLDSLASDQNCRFLKIDTPGAEIEIMKSGGKTMQSAMLIEIEGSPEPFYSGEPTLYEKGIWLHEQGFVLHTCTPMKWPINPYRLSETKKTPLNHVARMKLVFTKNFNSWSNLDNDSLISLAYLSHILYASYDLATRALHVLDSRDEGKRVYEYLNFLEVNMLDFFENN